MATDVLQAMADMVIAGPAKAGAIAFFGVAPDGFAFRCPCGCGALGTVRFNGPTAHRWNGDVARATVIDPIMLCIHDVHHLSEAPHWHGRLVDGAWETF